MSDVYNLDEGINESVEVILNGEKYRLELPTYEDIEKLDKLKTDEEREAAIYSFVKKTSKEQVEFREMLKKSNLKKVQKFTKAIEQEFGLEG